MGSSPPLPPRSPPKGGTTKPKPSLKLAKPGAMAFNYPKVCLPPITTCPTATDKITNFCFLDGPRITKLEIIHFLDGSSKFPNL